MTLFELQAWLGHRSPEATQHYAKITPNALARAYNDAGYFARNVRAIEVLVDRDAVTSGAAADGEPWQYYDLGHGYCAYTFFEQCPHRMACARCDFYTPKNSSKAQLLEAKNNLQQMLANIPLSDEEQAAVDDGQAALDQLLERLADTPTPTGATPREIGVPATATLLPIAAVNNNSAAGGGTAQIRRLPRRPESDSFAAHSAGLRGGDAGVECGLGGFDQRRRRRARHRSPGARAVSEVTASHAFMSAS